MEFTWLILTAVTFGKAFTLDFNSKASFISGFSDQYRSQNTLGEYAFGYNEDHAGGGSFRRETGDRLGNKAGSYGLRAADGRVRVVNYVADDDGFRADVVSNEPGLQSQSPNGQTRIIRQRIRAVMAPGLRYSSMAPPVSGSGGDGPSFGERLVRSGSLARSFNGHRLSTASVGRVGEVSLKKEGGRGYFDKGVANQEDGRMHLDDVATYQEDGRRFHEDGAANQEDGRGHLDDVATYQEDGRRFHDDGTANQENERRHLDDVAMYQDGLANQKDERRSLVGVAANHEDGRRYLVNGAANHEDRRRYPGDGAVNQEDGRRYRDDVTISQKGGRFGKPKGGEAVLESPFDVAQGAGNKHPDKYAVNSNEENSRLRRGGQSFQGRVFGRSSSLDAGLSQSQLRHGRIQYSYHPSGNDRNEIHQMKREELNGSGKMYQEFEDRQDMFDSAVETVGPRYDSGSGDSNYKHGGQPLENDAEYEDYGGVFESASHQQDATKDMHFDQGKIEDVDTVNESQLNGAESVSSRSRDATEDLLQNASSAVTN